MVLTTIFWEVIHLQVVVPLTSPLYTDKTFIEIEKVFFQKLLLPMALVNAVGILLFLFIVRDAIIRREVEIAEKELLEGKITEETKEE